LEEPIVKLNVRGLVTLCAVAFSISPAYAQDGGAEIYKAKCQMCHGPDGQGNTPAGKIAKIVSFKDPSVVNASDSDLIPVVKNGKNKMPGFTGKLSDDQINSVIAYIRTLQK
jgi:mono/diheme cytochrome c family protein